ncbi:MAG: proline--tRNA ligase [Solirubrobacteraceae bacterium]|nr:proline--tRNA ligase [Solirubrobacteraceae bacterium]
MHRLSQLLLPTERQPPADAEALSHQLMVRAGLVRQLGSGLWSWMPAGWRIHQKVVDIIREEMDAAGAQELSLPVLQPRELWEKTGRDQIHELFKLEDRKGSEMVLAMTHEEAVTTHVAQIVKSYRELPFTLYQVQTKERDEPRPRAGILRTREFVMKDAYSFDRDDAGLDASYEAQTAAYAKIYDRCGVRWYRVESDVGMMGGAGAHEYMAPCAAGEDDIVLAEGYAANVEVATTTPSPAVVVEPIGAPEPVETPDAKTIERLAELLGIDASATMKAVAVVGPEGLVLVLLRGDDTVQETKLANALGGTHRPATEEEIAAAIGPAGYLGPIEMADPGTTVLLDLAVGDTEHVVGANKAGVHLRGVQPGRDFQARRVDVRAAKAGDTVDGKPVEIVPAIEVGNIFKLGTKYTEALGATFLDEDGKRQPIIMGCYGIGPARIVASTAEQCGDERGIAWPKAIAPWQVHVAGLGKPGSPEAEAAAKLAATLDQAGFEVILDDRAGGAGEKLTDAELLGCPLRLVVGRRTLERGEAEAQRRRGSVELDPISLDDPVPAVRAHLAAAP